MLPDLLDSLLQLLAALVGYAYDLEEERVVGAVGAGILDGNGAVNTVPLASKTTLIFSLTIAEPSAAMEMVSLKSATCQRWPCAEDEVVSSVLSSSDSKNLTAVHTGGAPRNR